MYRYHLAGTPTTPVAGLDLEGLRLLNSSRCDLRHPMSSTDYTTRDWSDFIKFDAQGRVVALNLGVRGRDLSRGFFPVGGMDGKNVGSEAFFKFFALRMLNLEETNMPVEHVATLLRACAPRRTLKRLYAGGNGWGDAGATMISAWLHEQPYRNNRLVGLYLSNNDITDTGVAALCDGLLQRQASNNNRGGLRFLDLEGNQIGETGCVALADFLVQPGQRLRRLFLGANRIGPEGASVLARTIPNNNAKLVELDLEGNHIGDAGAFAFCEALEACQGQAVLTTLTVDNNNIGKEGILRLDATLPDYESDSDEEEETVQPGTKHKGGGAEESGSNKRQKGKDDGPDSDSKKPNDHSGGKADEKKPTKNKQASDFDLNKADREIAGEVANALESPDASEKLFPALQWGFRKDNKDLVISALRRLADANADGCLDKKDEREGGGDEE